MTGLILITNDQSIRVDQVREEILKGLCDRHTTPLVAGGLTRLQGNAIGFLSHSSIFQDKPLLR